MLVAALLSAVMSGAPAPSVHLVDALFSEGEAPIERQLASLAMTWLAERNGGCTAFITEVNDPALLAAEIFGDLTPPRFSTARAPHWIFWRAWGLWTHSRVFGGSHRELASAFDAAVLSAGHSLEPAQLEWAALMAISEWDAVVARGE
jgi:hypothetical protein